MTVVVTDEITPLSYNTKKSRKVNNLKVSLGRMGYVKGKTLQWLKLFEKAGRRHTPVSVNVYVTPVFVAPQVLEPYVQLANTQQSAEDVLNRTQVIINSPVSSWLSSPCLAVRSSVPCCIFFTCSFCEKPLLRGVDLILVSFNAMLPYPYVLTCVDCGQNTSNQKRKNVT